MDIVGKQVVIEKMTRDKRVTSTNKTNIDHSELSSAVEKVEKSILTGQRNKKHIKIFDME